MNKYSYIYRKHSYICPTYWTRLLLGITEGNPKITVMLTTLHLRLENCINMQYGIHSELKLFESSKTRRWTMRVAIVNEKCSSNSTTT